MGQELKDFVYTKKTVEEDEHSLELHLPFIYKALGNKPFKLVPIMVGNTNPKLEQYFGSYLAKYFDDPNTVFIISSDFCHWGKG
jgi:AmmeMemoRadiSam system protein B